MNNPEFEELAYSQPTAHAPARVP